MRDDGVPVVIVGAGGHARVVAESLADRPILGHVAPRAASSTELGPWLGDDDVVAELAAAGHAFVPAVGFVDRAGARRRGRLLRRLREVPLATVVHPEAIVSARADIGSGSFIGPGAVVGVGTTVGLGAIVNSGAVVDHDCRLGDNVHVGPGAALSGGVSVGDDVLVGVGASVLQNVRIGSDVIIGAGSVVIDDIGRNATAVGAPARATTLRR